MHSFDYRPTTRVLSGSGYLEKIAQAASDLGLSNILIVSDPGIEAAGYVTQAERSLVDAGFKVSVFTDVQENPTSEHVAKGAAFAASVTPDGLVALGGGSAMDACKGINFIYSNGGQMVDYWGHGKAQKPMLPCIGIPTTAGTGSEAQSYALISDPVNHRKMACGDIKARFHTVILDPQLCGSAPRDVIAVSGLDAVSHALESYVSTAATPISRMFSKEAWRLLNTHFEQVLDDPSNTEAWAAMQLGAHYAGLAIENAMLGAAHACANPLTAHFGTTHGQAVAVMLPSVIRFNAAQEQQRYSELWAVGGGSASKPAAESLAQRVEALCDKANLATSLKALGIQASDLDRLAEHAGQQWTGKFNPIPVSPPQLHHIYQRALEHA